MSNQWEICDGCKIAHPDGTEWQVCNSCYAMFCKKTSYEIFKWGGKEQCCRCTKLLSQISVQSSDVLAWIATKFDTKVENIEEKYKQEMLKSGEIIDDSLCTRCGRECDSIWDYVEEEEHGIEIGGLCCICLGRQTKNCYECLSATKKKLESLVPTGQMKDLALD